MIYRTSVSTGALLAILLVGPPKFLLAQTSTVTCSSKEGERQLCPADTSAGVAFQRSLGSAECLLGKTWGYDGAGLIAIGTEQNYQLIDNLSPLTLDCASHVIWLSRSRPEVVRRLGIHSFDDARCIIGLPEPERDDPPPHRGTAR